MFCSTEFIKLTYSTLIWPAPIWFDLFQIDLTSPDLSWHVPISLDLFQLDLLQMTCPEWTCLYSTCPNLTCAKLTCPNLISANLTCPDLISADLTCPDFIRPNSTFPNLTCPILCCPDLVCPELTYPDWTFPHLTFHRHFPHNSQAPQRLPPDQGSARRELHQWDQDQDWVSMKRLRPRLKMFESQWRDRGRIWNMSIPRLLETLSDLSEISKTKFWSNIVI